MKLLFVYNAEAGLVRGMLDSIHKTVSPETYECALCQLAHGLFTMDKSWRNYLQELPIESVFFHRQEFNRPILRRLSPCRQSSSKEKGRFWSWFQPNR